MSLAQVVTGRVGAQVNRFRRLPVWRRAAAWGTQPFVTTRGHLLLAAACIGAVVLGQAAMRGGGSPRQPVAPMVVVPARSVMPLPLAMVAPTPRLAPLPVSLGDPPRVVGIVGRLPGNAVVLVKAGNRTQAIAVGGSAGDWTLVELSPTEAVFERAGARRTVELAAVE